MPYLVDQFHSSILFKPQIFFVKTRGIPLNFIAPWFVVVEAGIETGGWKPETRVSRASIDTSIDNLKRNLLPFGVRAFSKPVRLIHHRCKTHRAVGVETPLLYPRLCVIGGYTV